MQLPAYAVPNILPHQLVSCVAHIALYGVGNVAHAIARDALRDGAVECLFAHFHKPVARVLG